MKDQWISSEHCKDALSRTIQLGIIIGFDFPPNKYMLQYYFKFSSTNILLLYQFKEVGVEEGKKNSLCGWDNVTRKFRWKEYLIENTKK